MIPTVGQQLFAVRNTVAKVVLPAIDPADGFATEQAGLVLACVDWVMDVQASEFRYELLEHGASRDTLRALLELAADPGAQELLDETAITPPDLVGIRDQVGQLKAAVVRRFEALCEQPELRTPARRILTGAARAQAARELSWCRMTGFPQGPPADIASVLEGQAAQQSAPVAVG
ncbi:hypothetical protein GP2_024_00390 [Gordonia paraffinivorans NBRC 108238]|uniref:Uncharacterized protein n=1 Tax=Gordonia paraffinivorans NBRC 108238 TaxID=1223543 RepID=A0ABQ0IM28_9ACTN|nr:hypothetical protein [Gordonia paraffinivorans]GAC84612.1 hypothetical protein GP2_024_00390 [Gordonia paraffinivorans NBRC 108238]